MKRGLILLNLLTLFKLSSFCQETYPKAIALDKDTIVAITVTQAKDINVTYLKLARCSQINDSLTVQIEDYERIKALQDNSISSYKYQNFISENKCKVCENTLIEANREIGVKEDQMKKLKISRNFFISVSFLVALTCLLK